MGRGLLSGFCSRGKADDAGTIREREQVFASDNVFDIGQPLVVQGHDFAGLELFLFKRLDDIAVVGRGQISLFGDLSRNGLHLGLYLGEGLVSEALQLVGSVVDAEVTRDLRHTILAAGGNRSAPEATLRCGQIPDTA